MMDIKKREVMSSKTFSKRAFKGLKAREMIKQTKSDAFHFFMSTVSATKEKIPFKITSALAYSKCQLNAQIEADKQTIGQLVSSLAKEVAERILL